MAIGYLGVFGSLIGCVIYFYVLQRLDASAVALVTILTPVFAIALGAALNKEPMTANLLLGGIFVLLGLGLFQFGYKIAPFVRKETVEAQVAE